MILRVRTLSWVQVALEKDEEYIAWEKGTVSKEESKIVLRMRRGIDHSVCEVGKGLM